MKRILYLGLVLTFFTTAVYAGEITITIPTAIQADVITAVCTRAGVEVSAANAKAIIRSFIRETYKAWKVDTDATSYKAAVESDADTASTTVTVE